jgi:hypothetical protein
MRDCRPLRHRVCSFTEQQARSKANLNATRQREPQPRRTAMTIKTNLKAGAANYFRRLR